MVDHGMKKSRQSAKQKQPALPVIQPDVAFIDLASEEHWVCAPPFADGRPNVRVFGATTPQLHALADWLAAQHVTSVAMESTGVYWIPVFEVLEERGFGVVLANARQTSHVPGRKTDMKDCQWGQLLHSCGLLRGSFRPGQAISSLRALMRQRSNLIAERTRAVQWMQKALDQMNVLVHRAVTDITGKTGMQIVRAILAGERDPRQLASLRDGRCQKSEDEIAEHLTGTWRSEHLFNLRMALQLYYRLEQMIADYDERLRRDIEALQPPERQTAVLPAHPLPLKEKAIAKRGDQQMREALWRFAGVDLTRIDGISVGSAETILTEVGLDLSAFPSEKHFVSWLRLCPRTPISGGKPLHKRQKGMGATRVANVLRTAALSLARSSSALGAYYRKTARQKHGGVAVFATARKLATLIYRMLRFGQDYVDIGEHA
jgi:transposase